MPFRQTRILGFLLVLCACALIGLSWAALTRSTPADSSLAEARASLTTLSGVPEDGINLGSASAPATLVAYVDPTYRSEIFEPAVLRTLISKYVATSKLKLQVRTLSTSTGGADGPGTLALANVLQAAGLQDRLWQLYAVLNARYTGVLDAPDVTGAARLIPGLDARAVLRDAVSPRVNAAVARADRYAEEAGVTDPPAFFLREGPEPAISTRLSARLPLLQALAAALGT